MKSKPPMKRRHYDYDLPLQFIAAVASKLFAIAASFAIFLGWAFAPVYGTPVSQDWQQKVTSMTWVAYSPPTSDPNKGIEATEAEIQQDLAVLRKAGFRGLVTYGATGILGRKLPDLAKAAGFDGMIMGLWSLNDAGELAAAKAAAQNSIVLGYSVGNEGYPQRYDLKQLSAAIETVRTATGKPVTTTEQIDKYSNDELLQIGDWVFPNTHPYFHNVTDPGTAAKWTIEAYKALTAKTKQFVLFKEVGLPTAGGRAGELSEENQSQYYIQLAKSGICFVYFEAFDEPWKTSLPVEPHWGIFQSDRKPKLLAYSLMGKPPPPTDSTDSTVPNSSYFYVYSDASSPDNHFTPTGYMGDLGDITINQAWEENPKFGKTCIKIVYSGKGSGPHSDGGNTPSKWAGTYWQEPANNWGTEARLKDSGFNLSKYDQLTFWARADKDCVIEFKVGGMTNPFGDSLTYPASLTAHLTKDWQPFKIPLKSADLHHIVGGFCWVSNQDTNPGGATFYLDEIRFEKTTP